MATKHIDPARTEELRRGFINDPELRVRENAVTRAGIDTAIAPAAYEHTPDVFSLELKTGDICAQKSSGRCWLFAAMNVLRMQVMRRCGLETFELSQAYMMFWDKYEKANFFLECVLDTLDDPLDGRVVSWLLSAPFGDGGQWDMAAALVDKYGVVPKYAMPETFSSSNSARMNKFLTLRVREYAKTLRDGHAAGQARAELAEQKDAMLREIYDMLCICLGVPPVSFDFECRGEEGGFTQELGMTPTAFYQKYVGLDLSDYVSLINAPTADKPFHRSYTVSRLGNVVGGRPVRYLNLPIDRLRATAIAQLQDGEPVWFGSEVGQMLDRDKGLMSMELYDADNLFCTRFGLDKAARLDYGESKMTHAMVIQGVNLANGQPNRWKVENSWGDKIGEKGWFRMSDEWFGEYVFQIVVHKKYLTDAERAELAAEPIVLAPWDPMGSLAQTL